MSWHFSLALGAAYSEATGFSGGELSVPSKLTHFAATDSCSDKTKDTSHRSQFGTTFPPSTVGHGAELLRLFLGGSRAKTSAQSVPRMVLKANKADCGSTWPGSFVRFDRNMSLWKTAQLSLFADSEPYSEIWPRWGWMHGGECFHRAPLVPHIHEKECSLWPTPRASFGKSGWGHGVPGNGRYRQDVIERCNAIGWAPSCEMLEAVLGIPIGWTGVGQLGMDRIQRWLREHSGCSMDFKKEPKP